MPICNINPDPLNLRRWKVAVFRHTGDICRYENVWAENAYNAVREVLTTRLGLPGRVKSLGGRKDGTQRDYAGQNCRVEVTEDFS